MSITDNICPPDVKVYNGDGIMFYTYYRKKTRPDGTVVCRTKRMSRQVRSVTPDHKEKNAVFLQIRKKVCRNPLFKLEELNKFLQFIENDPQGLKNFLQAL